MARSAKRTSTEAEPDDTSGTPDAKKAKRDEARERARLWAQEQFANKSKSPAAAPAKAKASAISKKTTPPKKKTPPRSKRASSSSSSSKKAKAEASEDSDDTNDTDVIPTGTRRRTLVKARGGGRNQPLVNLLEAESDSDGAADVIPAGKRRDTIVKVRGGRDRGTAPAPAPESESESESEPEPEPEHEPEPVPNKASPPSRAMKMEAAKERAAAFARERDAKKRAIMQEIALPEGPEDEVAEEEDQEWNVMAISAKKPSPARASQVAFAKARAVALEQERAKKMEAAVMQARAAEAEAEAHAEEEEEDEEDDEEEVMMEPSPMRSNNKQRSAAVDADLAAFIEGGGAKKPTKADVAKAKAAALARERADRRTSKEAAEAAKDAADADMEAFLDEEDEKEEKRIRVAEEKTKGRTWAHTMFGKRDSDEDEDEDEDGDGEGVAAEMNPLTNLMQVLHIDALRDPSAHIPQIAAAVVTLAVVMYCITESTTTDGTLAGTVGTTTSATVKTSASVLKPVFEFLASYAYLMYPCLVAGGAVLGAAMLFPAVSLPLINMYIARTLLPGLVGGSIVTPLGLLLSLWAAAVWSAQLPTRKIALVTLMVGWLYTLFVYQALKRIPMHTDWPLKGLTSMQLAHIFFAAFLVGLEVLGVEGKLWLYAAALSLVASWMSAAHVLGMKSGVAAVQAEAEKESAAPAPLGLVSSPFWKPQKSNTSYAYIPGKGYSFENSPAPSRRGQLSSSSSSSSSSREVQPKSKPDFFTRASETAAKVLFEWISKPVNIVCVVWVIASAVFASEMDVPVLSYAYTGLVSTGIFIIYYFARELAFRQLVAALTDDAVAGLRAAGTASSVDVLFDGLWETKKKGATRADYCKCKAAFCDAIFKSGAIAKVGSKMGPGGTKQVMVKYA